MPCKTNECTNPTCNARSGGEGGSAWGGVARPRVVRWSGEQRRRCANDGAGLAGTRGARTRAWALSLSASITPDLLHCGRVAGGAEWSGVGGGEDCHRRHRGAPADGRAPLAWRPGGLAGSPARTSPPRIWRQEALGPWDTDARAARRRRPARCQRGTRGQRPQMAAGGGRCAADAAAMPLAGWSAATRTTPPRPALRVRLPPSGRRWRAGAQAGDLFRLGCRPPRRPP